jgi:hypothetical protein
MPFFTTPKASAFGQHVIGPDGAKLFFYDAGTVNPKTTHTTAAQTVAQSHPVVADGNGLFEPIFITGTYKVALYDKNDVLQWSVDNIQGETGAVALVGDFDSSTNAGNYPAAGSLGDQYKVSAGFTLAAASGSHVLNTFDLIICNKDSATGIDADWNIIKGVATVIDEDSLATNSASRAPSQQSVAVYVAAQVLDEDDFVSDSPTKPPSQQSVAAFVEAASSATETLNLRAANNLTTPSAKIDISANVINIEGYAVNSFAKTVDKTVSGLDGLDTGVMAADTWYHFWAIYNPSAGLSGSLLSLASPISGTVVLPSGYTKKKYVGAIYSDVSTVFNNDLMSLNGNYVALDNTALNPTITTTSPTAMAMTSVVPPNATSVFGYIVLQGLDYTCTFYCDDLYTTGRIRVSGDTSSSDYKPFTINITNTTLEAFNNIASRTTTFYISGYTLQN